MKPTVPALARVASRIIPKDTLRKSVGGPAVHVYQMADGTNSPRSLPSLMEQLTTMRADADKAGTPWPANIRLEAPVKKVVLREVGHSARKELKALMKRER